eukprot:IDg17289t1
MTAKWTARSLQSCSRRKHYSSNRTSMRVHTCCMRTVKLQFAVQIYFIHFLAYFTLAYSIYSCLLYSQSWQQSQHTERCARKRISLRADAMASRALRASAHPLDALRAQRATQSEQESALRRTVSTATALRDAAAADVRALEYVSDLTRDETARRRQGNQHLARAYSGSGSASIPSIDSEGAVQRAEAALLLAKAELAALRLSIDELHARR